MKTSKKFIFPILVLILVTMLFGCTEDPIICLENIPEYSGDPYVPINGGEPYFTEEEITKKSYEKYSPLDYLGRCGVAVASLGIDLMPTEDRGQISSVTPSGWEYDGKSNNKKYDFGYIYNRCHLIGWQLAGEDATKENLITGTAYMNIEGMLPFENMIADYIKETENHVMYRVSPIYHGTALVASGVLLEALSVEDSGDGIKFCVYVYNIQPGIEIDYFTGLNKRSGEETKDGSGTEPDDGRRETDYILNTSSKKFHLPDRSCSNGIIDKNREQYRGYREDLIEAGYSPCGTCKP